ncbi:unnamed protein product [Ectocarpus sp. 12 AP-2014]
MYFVDRSSVIVSHTRLLASVLPGKRPTMSPLSVVAAAVGVQLTFNININNISRPPLHDPSGNRVRQQELARNDRGGPVRRGHLCTRVRGTGRSRHGRRQH